MIENRLIASKKSIKKERVIKDLQFSKKGMKFINIVIPEEEKNFNE